MIKTIQQTLFTGWHLMRWVRLAFGIFFLIQAIQDGQSIMWLGAAFFLFTSLTNIGCCGGNGSCSVPRRRDPIEKDQYPGIQS